MVSGFLGECVGVRDVDGNERTRGCGGNDKDIS